MPIRAPREQGNYPDRLLECEEALEVEVTIALDEAQSVGWSSAEAALAIAAIAENYLLAQCENARTEYLLLKARMEQEE